VDTASDLSARETVQQLLTVKHQTIAHTICPANSADLSSLICLIWEKLQEHDTVSLSRIHDVAQQLLKSRLVEKWEHYNQVINLSSMKQSGSDVHVIELAFEQVEGILNQTLIVFNVCTLAVTCLSVANSGHFVSLGDLAKHAISLADVDTFY